MSKYGYHRVANKKDLQEGKPFKVEPEGKSIVLSMVNGKVYAMDAVCSHEGGPLEDGTLDGYNLTCPWHYAVFDVRDAKVSDQTVWATDLTSYPIEIDQDTGDILLSLEPSLSSSRSDEQKQSLQQQLATEPASTAIQRGKEEEENSKNEFELTLLNKHEHSGTDIMSFRFSKQDNIDKNRTLDYIPGQYAFFDIGGVTNDPKGPIRHFSIASSPTEDFVMISTRIRDTPYKKRLSSLKEGDGSTKVKVRGPQGKFVLYREDYSNPAVLLSGGIGVTPFRSIIKYATDKKLPLKIIMFDSNRDVTNILYKEEFDEWLKINKNLKIIYTITEVEEKGIEGREGNLEGGKVKGQEQHGLSEHESWKGERGRINEIMLKKYLTNDDLANSIFYTCGPPGMLKAMQTLLQETLQISKEKIKVEEFTGY